MKKQLVISRLFLGMLFAYTNFAGATDQCEYTYEDCCGGCWGLQIQAGVYPTIWNKRGDLLLNACDCASETVGLTPVDLGAFPKFSSIFGLPWIVGGQLTYDWSEHFTLYGELNYIQANRKKNHPVLSTVNPALSLGFGHYRAVSGYFGIRYYTCPLFCDTTQLFIGGKVGFLSRANIHARSLATITEIPASCSACDLVIKRDFFRHRTDVSGGVNFGADFLFCNSWSFVITGEVVATRGPRSNCIALTDPEIFALAGGSFLSSPRIKTEISFPVTFGLKYHF